MLQITHTFVTCNIEEIRQLTQYGESDRIERTISVNNMDKFLEAVCPFAKDLPNHRLPDYLFIGSSY